VMAERVTDEDVDRATVKEVFSTEFKAELLERTQECDRLRADLAEARRNYDVANKAHEAAELRIVELREQVKFAGARADDNEATVRRYMDTIARVEALPAKWRDCEGEHCARCADDLEAALKGGGA
jgi:chromosome segregation ATPase